MTRRRTRPRLGEREQAEVVPRPDPAQEIGVTTPAEDMAAERHFAFSRAHARALAKGMGHDEALGFAMAAEYAARAAVIPADRMLAGMPGSASLVKLDINGLTCADQPPAAIVGTAMEAEARETIARWLPQTTGRLFAEARAAEFSAQERMTLEEPSLGWGGGWGGHAILGYERLLAGGIGGLRAFVAQNMAAHEAAGADAATLDWFRGLGHVCDGIGLFIANHAAAADGLAAAQPQGPRRAALQQLATDCRHISTHPPRHLRQAVQLFWFIHVLDNTDSPGRLDQFLLPHYLRLADTPDERSRLAMPILDALWRGFIACRSWNVCLAGQTADGRDAANELTYLFLDLQARHGREAPNLSVRFFSGSDRRLLERCTEVLAKGSGLPALYNDDVMVPALCRLGIPLEHARDYAMNGCAQVDIQGLSHMGLEDGELNLAKCLELALHGGQSPVTRRQAGAATPGPEQIADLPALMEQYRRQVRHCSGLFTRQANLFQRVIAQSGPHLLRSLFVEPCIVRGRDFKRGGPLYNHGQFLTQGIANTGDSLHALRQIVFDGGRMTLAEFVRITDVDWAGHEALRREALDRVGKFGNDLPTVDALAAEAMGIYFRALGELRTWRGGAYSGGVIVYVRAIGFGKNLAATPDGRRSGEPVADSMGPSQGRDRRGLTAMLQSAARLPQSLGACAQCLNVKLSPTVFTGPGGIAKIADLFATYFRLGGQQLQVNVVNADTLRAARREPDKHRDLVVRVGGFCARFTQLEPAQQDDIIARTEHLV